MDTGRIRFNQIPLQQIPRPTNPIVQELIRRYEDYYDIYLEMLKEEFRKETE